MEGQGHGKHYTDQKIIQGKPARVSNMNNNYSKCVKGRTPEEKNWQ